MGDVIKAAKVMMQPSFRPDKEKAFIALCSSYEASIVKETDELNPVGNNIGCKEIVLYR